jgi:transcriptional regulator with XRE-family HTH domain
MDIGNKILELRKKNNLSQEQIAEKMKVARQTISKWELGETSPDIKQAKELSKIFNVSLDELVDNDIKDLVIEKVSNTEKLAGIILKLFKIFLIIIPTIIALVFLLAILFRISENSKNTGREITETIDCELYGEEHGLSITYEELTGRPISLGGDSYFDDILDIGKYHDAIQIFNVINDYVKKNGGTCYVESKEVND